jgi:predicted  nucleic acid-binding Zn-ribbon protein
MSGIHRLDEAFARFDAAMAALEDAVAVKAEGSRRVAELEGEAETLRRDRSRLASEIDLLRNKAGELAITSRSAAGKIDAAMSRIRAVLHSNAPE